MEHEVTIHHIESFRALDAAGAIAGIWQAAHDVSAADAQAFATGTFPKHVRWPGFSLYLAAISGHPAGFLYGYQSLPGQWWHDQVAPALRASGHGDWLTGSMELAEIAVLPQFQGRGIGSLLVEAFLAEMHRPVILALEAGETSAQRLYTRHGFGDLITDFRYADWPDDPMMIMGRETPKEIPS